MERQRCRLFSCDSDALPSTVPLAEAIDDLYGNSSLENRIRMVIGVLQVELAIDEPRSLKDKRRVVNSLKARLHQRHQVSVAEVGSQDDHHTAVLGITMASSSVPYCQGALDRVLRMIRVQRGCVLGDHKTEILTGQ